MMRPYVLFAVVCTSLMLLAGIQVVKVAEANPVPYDSSGTSNVEVSIISPQNKTYDTNNIELTADFGAFPGVWYIGYSLDGGSYIEIAPGHPILHDLTETLSLNQLPKGQHSIEVKATAMANDEDGTVIACSKVYFTVTKTLETLPPPNSTPIVTPMPTLSKSSTPTITPTIANSNWLNQITLAAIVIVVVILAIALVSLVYQRRRKKQ